MSLIKILQIKNSLNQFFRNNVNVPPILVTPRNAALCFFSSAPAAALSALAELSEKFPRKHARSHYFIEPAALFPNSQHSSNLLLRVPSLVVLCYSECFTATTGFFCRVNACYRF